MIDDQKTTVAKVYVDTQARLLAHATGYPSQGSPDELQAWRKEFDDLRADVERFNFALKKPADDSVSTAAAGTYQGHRS